jgi:hypothetical protein
VSMFNYMYWNSYAILSTSKFVSNSLGTRFELFIASVPRKPECSVCQTRVSSLEFEF